MLIFPLGGAVHDIIEHGTFFKLDTTLAFSREPEGS